MIRGLYTAASGMIARQAQQENLSNNIANVNTAGFKKNDISFKSFDQYMVENRDNSALDSNFPRELGKMEFGVGINSTKTYFSQGVVQDTGRNLDFALNGDGFFTVLDSNGNEKYTRDGRFSISSDGYLVTSTGDQVLGVTASDSRTPVPIRITNQDFKLGSDGSITDGENNYKFCLKKFTNSTDIVKDANNCYTLANKNADLLPADTTKVTQNSLEQSNVDTIQVMTDMISIMRSYESNQKVMQQIDETLGKTVNDVGTVR